MNFLEIDNIFDTYIKSMNIYEKTFYTMLKTMEPSLTDEIIRQLPQNIFLHAISIMENFDLEKGRETYITTGKLFGNNFLTRYMDLAVKDFQTNPQGCIDLLSQENKDSFYGQVYEGVVAGLTSNSKLLLQMLKLPEDGNIKIRGKGVGTEKHPGDIQMTLYNFDLNKAVDLGSYIEVKYSKDYTQAVASAYRKSTDRFASTDQVWEQIEKEIKNGLESSLSANFSTGWIEDEEIYSVIVSNSLTENRNNLNERDIIKELDNIEKYIKNSTPKVLIYIFSSKGIWASQLLEELRPIVKSNAQYIIRNKRYGVKKNRLWYAQR